MATLIGLMLLSAVLSSAWAGTPSMFLKVNQYHVLYTDPIIPHVKKGCLLVGLKGMSTLLDASLTENIRSGSAVFSRAGHTVRFTAGSRWAWVNAKSVVMPIQAIQVKPSGHLAVPLSVLVSGLHLHGQMDAKCHTFVIICQHLTKTVDEGNFPYMVRTFANPYFGGGKAVIVPYSLRFRKSAGSNIEAAGEYLEVTVKNVSGKFEPHGAGICLLTQGESQEDGRIYGLPTHGDLETSLPPSVPVGGLQKTKVFVGMYPQRETHYVIGWLTP